MRQCSIPDCNKKHYAKGYCKNHYCQFQSTGNPHGSKRPCKNDKCTHKVAKKDEVYCSRCLHNPSRYRKRISTKGEKNGNWNGGTSEYKNHYQMKINRLIKLRDSNHICDICGKTGNVIHHKDHNKSNHSVDNLQVLCYQCHLRHHLSKFTKIYGFTIEEISKKLGISPSTVSKRHKKGILVLK